MTRPETERLTVEQFLPELKVPAGLTVDDLTPAAALVREWSEGDDPEGDPTGVLVVVKVCDLLAAADTTRQAKALLKAACC